jgi:hypothetical protein
LAGVVERRGETPRVSVVMPVFNAASFLAEAVESVLGQTLHDLELVVVDDGSADGSREILERYARTDQRVKVVAHETNLGASAAMNQGAQLARAPYVAIAHADDVALPVRLSRQVEFLDAHPSVAVVGGAVIVIDEAGRRGPIMQFPTNARVIRQTLLRHNCLAHPTVMLRREALGDVGGYRFDYVEDYDLWLRLSERFDIANLPEPLILYRLHAFQLSILALEERERPRLAVRAAAQARRLSQLDPLAGVEKMTPAILARVDIDVKDIRRAVETEWLARAALLAEFDHAAAEDLVAHASQTLGQRATMAFMAAKELRRAETLVRAGRPLAGAGHVLVAFRHEPRYAFSRIKVWLRDHLPARFV